MKNQISLEEVQWEIQVYDWTLWRYSVMVSDWVLSILTWWDEEAIEKQKEKIWAWLMNKESITLYRQGYEVHTQYWEKEVVKPSKVMKLTKQQIDFIINWDLEEVMKELDRIYKL